MAEVQGEICMFQKLDWCVDLNGKVIQQGGINMLCTKVLSLTSSYAVFSPTSNPRYSPINNSLQLVKKVDLLPGPQMINRGVGDTYGTGSTANHVTKPE
jgi:hypothetical protein